MLDIDRLYLDTNVFIAMAEGANDLSSALYDLAADQGMASGFLCTSELALAELLVKPYRDQNNELIDLYDGWISSGSWLEVGPVDRMVLRYAAVLRQQYPAMKLPDAIHLSTAIGFGCSHCLTGDTRLPEEIRLIHTRWRMTKGPAVLRLVLLNLDNVTRIRSKGSS